MEAPWADAVGGTLDGHCADDADAVARTLVEGVRRGVITAAQRDRLLAIARERADAGRVAGGEPADAPGRRPLSAVAVAYWLGAALVVFALGWFLADRWERLGPAGVLGLAAAYATAFALASWRLAAGGLRWAAGVALGLVVATVPAAAWSLLRLAGEWPSGPWDDPLLRYEPYMATRRLTIALATLLAVLVALRVVPRARVRRVALGVPLAVASAVALVETGIALTPAEATWHLRAWVVIAAGAALFAIAYATDRATARAAAAGGGAEEDFAAWLYPASAVVVHFGLLDAWSQLGAGRPAVVGVGLLLLAAALALGRTWLLVFGALDVLWFLGWLAFDVFREVLSFPFVLAALGAAVIALTVLLQRRYPAPLRRAGAARAAGEAPRLPGGWAAALAPLAVALTLVAVQAPRAGARAAELARQERASRREARAAPRREPAARDTQTDGDSRRVGGRK